MNTRFIVLAIMLAAYTTIIGCAPIAEHVYRGEDPAGNPVEVRVLSSTFEFPEYACLREVDKAIAQLWLSVQLPKMRYRLDAYVASSDCGDGEPSIAFLSMSEKGKSLCMMRPVWPGEFQQVDESVVIEIADFCAELDSP